MCFLEIGGLKAKEFNSYTNFYFIVYEGLDVGNIVEAAEDTGGCIQCDNSPGNIEWNPGWTGGPPIKDGGITP